MARELVGYGYLIAQFGLSARQPASVAFIDSAAKGRQSITEGDTGLLLFEPRYRPKSTTATLVAHLQFALRYEGVNLEVLALLFGKMGGAEIEANLMAKPESGFARRMGFLFEWLTGAAINAAVAPKARYVCAADETLQFVLTDGPRNSKFRVIDNLPGNRQFCPMVRKTRFLREMVEKDLRQRVKETLARYDRDLLRRAAAFLYLKETHSSFEVEREKPSLDRAQRFADLLREAESNVPLSEERLADLQNAVLDPRFHEFCYRDKQNWVGRDLGYRKKVDFVPPRPEDVRSLMNGLVQFSAAMKAHAHDLDPVVAAAMLAFGFVFIHPFMDGNGRLHRFLIHDTLSATGFTPKGIVLPVSAVILANQAEYIEALERFSKPMRTRTVFDPDATEAPAKGNDAVYFRYFDATDQASFLFRALERTVAHDLENEINFLLGFDAAYSALKSVLDWPAHSLDLFIRLVHQNRGTLSKTKRLSHFPWMTDDELRQSEAAVVEAFKLNPGTLHSTQG